VNFDGILPPCWKAELVIFIFASPAANEVIAMHKIATTAPVIALRIIGPPIEIALNRQN
jgi:hypothetical protein